MSFPCQRIVPPSGDNKPHSMRRKLVFPLPFSPITASRVPGLTVTLISENSSRSPRLPLSATVWNIFGEGPSGSKKRNCRSVECYRVVLLVILMAIGRLTKGHTSKISIVAHLAPARSEERRVGQGRRNQA